MNPSTISSDVADDVSMITKNNRWSCIIAIGQSARKFDPFVDKATLPNCDHCAEAHYLLRHQPKRSVIWLAWKHYNKVIVRVSPHLRNPVITE